MRCVTRGLSIRPEVGSVEPHDFQVGHSSAAISLNMNGDTFDAPTTEFPIQCPICFIS